MSNIDWTEVLTKHWFQVRDVVPNSRWVGCACGWQQPKDDNNRRRHYAHLASVLDAALDAWLGADGDAGTGGRGDRQSLGIPRVAAPRVRG